MEWRWSDRSTRRLLAVAVFAITAAAFLPVVHNRLINWDDEDYFLTNTGYRGLAWENLRWCFTTTYMGHYQPLNWLSYAVDYSISGMNDLHVRLHQTQAILHGISAVIVMYAGRRLFRLIRPAMDDTVASLAGAAAALVFSLHPLRVESVAWSSARSDLIATPFFVLAVLVYLNAHADSQRSARPWLSRLGPVLLLYVLALLGKEFAVTLPAVLLVLDVYPLRRLPADSIRAWFDKAHRQVWVEKFPLFAVAALAVVNAFAAARAQAIPSVESHPISSRLTQVCVSLIWYPFKTLAPIGLSPLYEFPSEFGPLHPLAIRSAAMLAFAIVALILMRRRMPGLVAAAVCYAILILPVSGLTQRGSQMTADRYTYLACLPWATVAGYAFLLLIRRSRWGATLAAGAAIALMTSATRGQIAVWRDSETLWNYAIGVNDASGGAHAYLGHALEERRRYEDAVRAYRRSLELGWKDVIVHRNLAAIFNRQHRNEEAVAEYLRDIEQYPGRWESHYYLAVTYERMDEDEKARAQYLRALELNPNYVDAHVAMGRLLMKHGYPEHAETRLRHALSLKPDQREALERLAMLCAESKRVPEALQLIDQCIQAVEALGDRAAVEGLRRRRAEYGDQAATQPAG